MATLIQDYLERARASDINTRSKESINWFRANIQKTKINTNSLMREEKANLINSWNLTTIGKMYLVHYDPKHKETLPYYDTFPLVIPIKRYNDGFLGLNLHYLPLPLRAKLLDALMDTMNNESWNETTKMRVSYDIVNAASKFRYFEPCLKRYLATHFRSRFIQIEPEAWPLAAMLPVEQFEKSTKRNVWADSRKMVR